MNTYRYIAVTPGGETVRGEQTAESEGELEDKLARLDLELLSASPKRSLAGLARVRKLPRRDLINVLLHVQTLTQAGVPLIETLEDLRDSSPAGPVQAFSADLVDRIANGATLSKAMAESPWPMELVLVTLVETGETTGQLPEVLAELIEYLKWTDEISAQTSKLLRAPAFTAAVVVGAIGFLMVYLVPQLVTFIKGIGGELPPQTVALIWVSSSLGSYGWALVLLPVLLMIGIHIVRKASQIWRERIDGWKLEVPPIGPVLKKIILARFANSFALMYRSGVSVLDALRFCRGLSANAAYQAALDSAMEAINGGRRISDAFAALPLFPPLVVRMLRVGENTGALDKALANVSYFYQREVNDAVEKLQASIQPALTIVLGGTVAWILSAVILPIYDVIAKVKF